MEGHMEHMEQERKLLLEKLEELEGHGPSRAYLFHVIAYKD
jgi:hypothetical protein